MRQKISLFLLSTILCSSLTWANPVFLSPIDESLSDARLRFMTKFSNHITPHQLTQREFNHSIEQHIKQLFNTQKTLTEAQFITHHQSSFLSDAQRFREAQINQTKIRFDSIDKNQDGWISLHEFQTIGIVSFQRYDTNKDGWLTIADDQQVEETDAQQKGNATLKHSLKPLLSMPTTHSAQGFRLLYAQENTTPLSLADYLKIREQHYTVTDTNHDGKLSHVEYETEFLTRVDQTISKTSAQQTAFVRQRFQTIDRNHDGKISPNEVRTFAKHYFAFWDTDRNGIITQYDPLPQFN